MTYAELYEKANHLLEIGVITLGEYEEMTKPLDKEVQEWIPTNYDKYPITYPRAFQKVWVTDSYGEVRVINYGGERRIKAWMPYIEPKPYKSESEDKA